MFTWPDTLRDTDEGERVMGPLGVYGGAKMKPRKVGSNWSRTRGIEVNEWCVVIDAGGAISMNVAA